jgi:hypothetical protein
VQVLVQRCAEAVDEGHRPEAGRGAATGTVCAQAVFQQLVDRYGRTQSGF